MQHISILRAESVDLLNLRPGDSAVDCTVGGGGHAEEMLLRTAPDGKVLGLDRDPRAIEKAHERLRPFGSRAVLIQSPFDRLETVAESRGMTGVRGVLFDLGVSSFQLEGEGRGFSLRRDEPLDMRMDPEIERSAADLIRESDGQELETILREFGEERFASPIAEAIVRSRAHAPVASTGRLAEIVESAVPGWYLRGRLHPATKTFQALRIAVNGELGQLREGLRQAVRILAPGGRIAVISFHSLEDRIVKHMFRSDPALVRITKKPVVPGASEQRENPKSRSAKLRAAERKS